LNSFAELTAFLTGLATGIAAEVVEAECGKQSDKHSSEFQTTGRDNEWLGKREGKFMRTYELTISPSMLVVCAGAGSTIRPAA
jgi:hypothetical protein